MVSLRNSSFERRVAGGLSHLPASASGWSDAPSVRSGAGDRGTHQEPRPAGRALRGRPRLGLPIRRVRLPCCLVPRCMMEPYRAAARRLVKVCSLRLCGRTV